ncbi:hypothetical protein RclHR1_06930009 [Rhizophagus clarus]|uniref:Serine-threonine/tyrosine-protein kinase catalytic domain-containing protein n=1 Tax=Rhizophagus clarus TaxID=94130 RepID=A0A2Z6SAB5_9GLOM|nr:hypothetical protein RclHR1_06930009 [Rhizophagus clarus]
MILIQSVKFNHENCYNSPQKLWCKECVPRCIVEGWTSENDDIDHFIKDMIYNAEVYSYPVFLDGKYISDCGLSGPSDRQNSDNKIYEVLPYIAPEVLKGESYTKHVTSLALEKCNVLRPEFGKGTPEIYKKLAHRCMNAFPNQRPTTSESYEILHCWEYNNDNEKYGYKEKEVKAVFKKS